MDAVIDLLQDGHLDKTSDPVERVCFRQGMKADLGRLNELVRKLVASGIDPCVVRGGTEKQCDQLG